MEESCHPQHGFAKVYRRQANLRDYCVLCVSIADGLGQKDNLTDAFGYNDL